jgi:hypothetical protein
MAKALHWVLCHLGIHERHVTGHIWHCIWCRPVSPRVTPTDYGHHVQIPMPRVLPPLGSKS